MFLGFSLLSCFMSRKSRGCQYERKLVHLLYKMGFYCVRVAGSGSMKYPSPDLVASDGKRLIAFEVKSSQSDRVYLRQGDVDDLLEFSNGFKAEPWFAVHLLHKGWFYKPAPELVGLDTLRIDEGNTRRHF